MIYPKRREFMVALGASAFLTGRASGATGDGLHFTSFDHVAIAVDDVPKSVAFYSRLFGNTVVKDNSSPRRYLKLGPAYIAIAGPARGQESHRVDHIAAGVPGFDQAGVKQLLDSRGIKARESTVGLFVTDPDGIQVQLWTDDSWSGLSKTASPESVPARGEPIFRPTGLNHILLHVSDPDKSAAFYEKIFGPVTQRAPNRIWFQVGSSRLGLSPLAAGAKPAVNHFCVAAEPFDFASAMKKILAAGATEAPLEVEGWPEFHDPEGILAQVMMPRAPVQK